MDVREQSYATDLAQLEYSCELRIIQVCAAEIMCY